MKLTKVNDIDYDDYEGDIINSKNPDFVLEMRLSIPHDKRDAPYMHLIFGTQDERDAESQEIKISHRKAQAILDSCIVIK